jgi:hypothetical protein
MSDRIAYLDPVAISSACARARLQAISVEGVADGVSVVAAADDAVTVCLGSRAGQT